MRTSTQGAPLIFLHLPKTAGTTLTPILRRHFRADQIHFIRSDDPDRRLREFQQLPIHQRHQLGLLHGHQPFGMHEWLAPEARYLTMLREPVARVVSHYHYLRRKAHPLFPGIQEQSLEEFVRTCPRGEADNGQTRWLAGIWDDRPLTDDHLHLARRNLEQHFAWVGLTEHFDETLIGLGMTLGWWRLYGAPRNQATASAIPSLDEETRSVIAHRNALDIALYSHVIADLKARRSQNQIAQWLAGQGLRTLNAAHGWSRKVRQKEQRQ